MNVSKKGNSKTMVAGIAALCILALCITIVSILSIQRMQKTAAMIYDHPYTVSNEARAMRSRLLDMKGFISTMLIDSRREPEVLTQKLNERYLLQGESIDIIKRRYLGPAEDTAALDTAMQGLKTAQAEAMNVVADMSDEEIILYVEEKLYPAYDAVNDCLITVIAFADRKVQGLEKASADTARMTIISLALLTVVLPAFFLCLLLREKRSIREIRYRERLFDILSSNVDDVFFIYNMEKNDLEYISSNIERITGVPKSTFQENTDYLQQLVVEEDLAAYQEFQSRLQAGNSKGIDFRIGAGPEKMKWMRLQIYPEIVKDKVVRYVVALSDQTENMKTQQTLKDALLNAQHANAAKQNFLSRMSHEIRTPMNAIIGMTTIAGAYIEDRKRVEDCLEKIGYSSKHLMSLINDVLDMSKIDEGKMAIAHEEFNLEDVAESLTTIIYPQAAGRGLHFTMPLVDITQTGLVGDSLRLNQILLNLLSNALKFTPEGGKISLEVRQLRRKDGKVRLRFTVSDTGIGMSREFMDRLSLPFEQESAVTGQKYGGTGLGMSITKNLVTLMGGTITVESQLGKGSSFLVELDFDTCENEREKNVIGEQELAALKVLIADDDRDSCMHTSLLLKNLGIVSDWVLNGKECVEKVRASHRTGEDYDVCLVDWKMPDIDGVEVTRRIREFAGPDTLIIIITAYDWSAIEQEARQAGANAFLAKPVFESMLYNVLLGATGIDKTVRLQLSQMKMNYPQLEGCCILLAEDNLLNQEIVVELLKMNKITVECVSNGQEAVDRFLADAEKYDAILMDVQMPVMDGYRATELIRQADCPRAGTIPIIAMTADAFHEDMVKAAAYGMDAHISKPIDPDQVYRLLVDKIKRKQR